MNPASGKELSWEEFSGRDDPRQDYRIYRLCVCGLCGGSRLVDGDKCPDCRGEGRVRELLATAETPEAVGVALVTLGQEGEWYDAEGNPCGLGLLHVSGEVGKKWLVKPWGASPRQISDAGRLLATARKRGES